MVRLRQVVIVVIGLAVAAAMMVLGGWQLEVYQSQGERAARALAAAPAVPLTEVAPAGAAVRDGFGRSVWLTGRYDPQVQQLVPIEDQPGRFRVLTLLRQADGSAVPVVRGSSDADAPAPPPGDLTQTGVLLPSEDNVDDPYAVRLPVLAQTWPGPLVAGYVTLSADLARAQGLEPAEPPLPASSGRLRNGAYALQWWVFALFVLFMMGRMVRDVGRQGALDTIEPEAESDTAAETTSARPGEDT